MLCWIGYAVDVQTASRRAAGLQSHADTESEPFEVFLFVQQDLLVYNLPNSQAPLVIILTGRATSHVKALCNPPYYSLHDVTLCRCKVQSQRNSGCF